MGSMRMLDLFPKVPTDLSQATVMGGWFSTITGVLMLLLFQVELFSFVSAPIESFVVVDNALETTLQINFNMSFLDLPCEYLSVDALDVLGSNRVNITGQEIKKWHLDPEGVKTVYHGRNRQQRDLKNFDDSVTATIEELHADGVHAMPLNENDFERFLKESDLSIVAFHAPWCVWCQRLMPTLEALAEALSDTSIAVGTVDCTVEKDLCGKEKFGIRAFPTLKVFVEERLEPPDYSGHRTVEDMSAFLFDKAKGKTMKHRRAGRHAAEHGTGLHDDVWPGCMVSGHIKVNRVPGNFHIEAASKSHTFNGAMTNLSHVVHHLSFGEDPPRRIEKKLNILSEELRQGAPLDGNAYIAHEYHQAPHHFVKIVGTTYQLSSMRTPWHGYQAIANSQMMLYDELDVPEARFGYNLSPMAVLVKSEKRPWYDFVTKVLAIVGGTFSVLGLMDAAVYRASRKGGRQLK